MELWTAFLLGLVGSLHCAGMCGPLVLAMPLTGNSPLSFLLGRLAYNLGRIVTYCSLGALFGLIGKSLTLIGFQRWLSFSVGVLILIGLLLLNRPGFSARIAKVVSLIKTPFAKLLSQRSFHGTFLLGMLNGLLPCGLVYAACAGAVAQSEFTSGLIYMMFFGLGTIPMMLAIGLAGKKLQFTLHFKFQKLIPFTLILMSLLLILRGLALNIPYLSPDLAHSSCCHR